MLGLTGPHGVVKIALVLERLVLVPRLETPERANTIG